MADPHLLTDKARENHARVVRALEVCSSILKDVLAKDVSPSELKFKAQARHVFYGKLTKEEKDNIKDATEKKTYSNFDITFLYTLVRNLCLIAAPKSGWGGRALPLPYDTEIADDIERIRIIRNDVAGHRTKMSIEDSEFQTYWKELEAVCSRMETRTNKMYSKSLETIRTCTMNSRIEHIKTISKTQIAHFENSFQVNMERITNEGLRLLTMNNRLVISGLGGCGKSYTSLQISITLSKSMNNIPVYITDTTEDFCCVAGKDELQILVVDDPFGKSNKNQELLDSWESCFSHLEALSSQRKIYVLVCCRTSILDAAKSTTRKYDLFHERHELNLSGKFQLTRHEKEHLYLMYASHYNITIGEHKGEISKMTVQHISNTTPRLGFPQCCFLFFNSKTDDQNSTLDFFVRADVGLQREIESTKFTDPDCFLILSYILHCENCIIDVHNIDMKLLDRLYCILEFDKRPKHILQSYVETKLTEMYLIKRSMKQGCYTFQHVTILESILLCYCKNFCSFFLEMAPLSTIVEFIRHSTHENKLGEIFFRLSSNDDVKLAQIYVSNIISENLPFKFLEILIDLDENFLQILLMEAQRNVPLGRVFKSSRKARSIFVNSMILHLIRQTWQTKDAIITAVLIVLYPDVGIESYCWSEIFRMDRSDIVQMMFEFNVFDNPGTVKQNVINLALISEDKRYDRCNILKYVYKQMPHITNETALIMAMNVNDKKRLRMLLTGGISNLTAITEKISNQCNWDEITKHDDTETVRLIIEHAPLLINKNALVSAVCKNAKQCIRLMLNYDLLSVYNSKETSFTVRQWNNIMSKENSLVSAVHMHAKQNIRSLLICDFINKSHCMGKCSDADYWDEIFYNNDFKTTESILILAPWLISENTLFLALRNHAKQCIRLLLTYDRAVLSNFKKMSFPADCLCNIMKNDDLETIKLIVEHAPWLIGNESLKEAIGYAAQQCIRLLLTCDVAIMFNFKKISISKDKWGNIMKKDDVETVKIIVEQAPLLIGDDTLKEAIRYAAQQCIWLLLTYEGAFKFQSLSIHAFSWCNIMKKDDVETVRIILKLAPLLIGDDTVKEAIKYGAQQCIRLLLNRHVILGFI